MHDIVGLPHDEAAPASSPAASQPTAQREVHSPAAPSAWAGLSALHRLGFVAQLCLSAASLEQALQQACRLSPLWSTARFAYGLDADIVTIRWCPEALGADQTPNAEHIAEAVALWLQLVVCTAGPAAAPSAVHAPSCAHAALGALVACPIRDGGDDLKLCFDAALVRRANSSADPRLYAVLVRYAEQRLLELTHAESTSERVRKLLAQLETPSVDAVLVASRLGLGVRTLHRRLRGEGTTFRKVLDDHRLERCLLQLQAPDASAKQVAYALGFADPASFHRAFKRWTGSTVRAFRLRAPAAQ